MTRCTNKCSYCGHFMIPLEKRTTGTKDLHDIELGKLHEFVLRNFPSNVIQDFIEFKTGQTLTLSMSALRSSRSNVLKKSHGNVDMTPAKSLLHFLESVDGLEYKVLTGTYDEATDRVSVCQKNKKSRKEDGTKKGEPVTATKSHCSILRYSNN